MKNAHWKIYIAFTFVLLLGSCVESYMPPEIVLPNNFLVVDGYLNSGQGSSHIYLSRTQNLSDSTMPVAELNASVAIESEQNDTYRFSEEGNGLYTLPPLNVHANTKYRLKIETTGGKQYLSDFIAIKQTPAIDSITWKLANQGLNNGGVQVYVNTHDDQNNTWYYRWTYEETWQFNSAFQSEYDYINRQLVPRTENIYTCWRTESSTSINIGSSVQLSQDVIREHPLAFLPGTSAKLGIRYSILVKQYALSKEAYEYFRLLEKNTENLGTLFDPQPSQLTGNIRCVNAPGEIVIGYFDAAAETSKRIFIDKSQLPQWNTITGYEACERDTLDINSVPPIPGGYMFIERKQYYKQVDPPRGQSAPVFVLVTGAIISSTDCVDCRTRGTNIQPDFWE